MALAIINWMVTIIFPFAFIPQSINTIKTKKTDGLNPISYLLVFIGTILLGMYGASKGVEHGLAILMTNTILGVTEIIVMFYLFRNIKKPIIFYASLAAFIGVTITSFLVVFGVTNEMSQTQSLLVMIFGGFPIAFAFLPQTLTMIKNKDVKYVSLFAASIIAFSNALLIAVYVLIYIAPIGGVAEIIGMTISAFGFLIQLPIIYLKLTIK